MLTGRAKKPQPAASGGALRGHISGNKAKALSELRRATAVPVFSAIAHTNPGDTVALHNEQMAVQLLTQSLSHCQKLSDDMLGIVATFEKRLADLEDTMLPLHKQTSSLTRAQKSKSIWFDSCRGVDFVGKDIDSAIEQLERIRYFVYIAHMSPDAITEANLRGDYKGFVNKLEAINSSKIFFEENPQFEGAAKLLKNLIALEKKSLKLCEEEFVRVLQDCSRPLDVEKVGFPFPPNFSKISILTNLDD